MAENTAGAISLFVTEYGAIADDPFPTMYLRFTRTPTAAEMRDIYSCVGGFLAGPWFNLVEAGMKESKR